MDDELERLRRLRALSPGDVVAVQRLAIALERSGRVADAWELLAGAAVSALQGEKGRSLNGAASGLAAREPGAVLTRLQDAPYPLVRASLKVLAATGHVAPVVVLGCGPTKRRAVRTFACLTLARGVAHEPHLSTLEETVPIEDHLPMRGGIAPSLVAWARDERRFELLPWVAGVIEKARSMHEAWRPLGSLLDEARGTFVLLTGKPEPPIVVEDLLARGCRAGG